MSWRSGLEYAIKGGVSAVRGAVEGQLAAMKAQSDSEYREKMLQYQNRLADIEQYKAMSEATFREKELGEEARRADEAERTKRLDIVVTHDGKVLEINQKAKTAKYLADVGAETERETTETTAKSRERVAEIGAKADVDVAETTTQGRREVAEIGAETDLAIEESRAKTEAAADAVRLDIAEKGFASAEKIAAWELANKAYLAELEAAGKSGGAGGTIVEGLTPDQVERVDKLRAAYHKEKDYQDMQKMQTEYGRAVSAYEKISKQAQAEGEDLETGFGDVALINIFQRFIDPGVSVREGDVALLQQAEGINTWLERKIDAIHEGAKLSPQGRADMFELVTGFYTTAMARKSEDLTSRYQQAIAIDGLLRNSGVTVSTLGTDFAEVYRKFLAQQGGGETAEGNGDPNAPVPGLKSPETPAADATATDLYFGAPGSTKRDTNVERAVTQAIDGKWTAAELRERVTKMLTDNNIDDPMFLDDVMAAFASQSAAEEPATRNRQDFRNRGVKREEDTDAEQ